MAKVSCIKRRLFKCEAAVGRSDLFVVLYYDMKERVGPQRKMIRDLSLVFGAGGGGC